MNRRKHGIPNSRGSMQLFPCRQERNDCASHILASTPGPAAVMEAALSSTLQCIRTGERASCISGTEGSRCIVSFSLGPRQQIFHTSQN